MTRRNRRRIALQVTARGQARAETVWFSFASARMHLAGHAGWDRADRRRVRRTAAGRAECRRNMPRGERLAAVSGIMAAEAERCRG